MRATGRFTRRAMSAALVVTASIGLPAAQATNTDGGGTGLAFVPIVPCRLMDTRGASHVGPRNSPLGSGDTYNLAVTGANGQCTIPAQASAVAMNVTTVNGTGSSYLTLWPADASQPLASNLNWQANDGATPNKVDVKLGADGRINIFNNAATVDVIADVVGYYADHNHDDRYYTKAQVDAAVQAAVAQARTFVHHDTYNPLALIFFSGTASGNANCVQSSSGLQFLPLTVPVGATLISIEVDYLDGPSSTLSTVQFEKYTASATGATLAVIASTQVGANLGSATRVHAVLTPTTPEVLENGESLTLEVGIASASGNAFCGATLNYVTTN